MSEFVYEVVEDLDEICYSLGIFSSEEKALDFIHRDPPPSVDAFYELIKLQVRKHELDKEGHALYEVVFEGTFDAEGDDS